ncbi:MAG: hypothetical protein LBB29_01365 [Holosporaceae bacterium]|jgi:hypothetical protein|nr:hypothetical protein [Holosporaceae bacterium]
MNAFGNIMHMQFLLEDKVAYEVANDLHDLRKGHVVLGITGSVSSPAMKTFLKLYPLNKRILPDYWWRVRYVEMGFYSQDITNNIGYKFSNMTYIRVHDGGTLLKSRLWYDIYSMDGLLLVRLRGPDIHTLPDGSIIAFKINNWISQ